MIIAKSRKQLQPTENNELYRYDKMRLASLDL
jgi:hypothetical protein